MIPAPSNAGKPPTTERALGRIFTFYSYKGGTGRSMSLANVAWILAQAGHRVLAIDWDLEAPGLHRYFAPFLEDPEMVETPGLIDFFDQFQDGARRENLGATEGNVDWFKEYASLIRVAVPVNHKFPLKPATLTAVDVLDPASLVSRLGSSGSEIGSFIAGRLKPDPLDQFGSWRPGSSRSMPGIEEILRELNTIILGAPLWHEKRFEGVNLRSETQALLRSKPEGDSLAWLNRLLLEDSFPGEFPRSSVPPASCLHLVPAGRQGASYAMRVAGIRWDEFYERFGGGIFLEEVKAQLRQTYDFILIDSRTGLSDTSGICTVQMPDELVVCYTLNRQSILGASATAESASAMRRKPSGEYSLRVWPVAMRVELAEKDRLEAARTLARNRFGGVVRHLRREELRDYLGQSEVLYFPYYAYEEVLATVADRPGTTATLLSAMEGLTRRVTGVVPRSGPYFGEEERRALGERYRTAAQPEIGPTTRSTGNGVVRLFLSYSQRDVSRERVTQLVSGIEAGVPGARVFWDERVLFGEDRSEVLGRELRDAEVVLFLIGMESQRSQVYLPQLTTAMRLKKRIIPLLLVSDESEGPVVPVPPEIQSIQGTSLSERHWELDVAKLVRGLAQLATRTLATPVDPLDPQKGRWGGSPSREGYLLSGEVRAVSAEWFDVVLRVRRSDGASTQGGVKFHLHDTFRPQVVTVDFVENVAEWRGGAWGAFTVGAEIGDGAVTLELDLAQLADAPKVFRER